jgi:ABC-type nitrate/sulfonate/bicarbonate transport system permease component
MTHLITTGGRAEKTSPSRINQILRWPIHEGRPQMVSFLVVTASWEMLGRLWHFTFLPPLSTVLQASFEMIVGGEIVNSLLASLLSLSVGYGLASSLGLIIGSLMGRYRKIEYLLDIYLNAFLASPTLIWVPILFVFFGVSRFSQIGVVFLYSFWLIVANTMTGIQNTDGSLIQMARSFGANERQLFWRIILPGALPLIMAGLRIGMGRAVKGMINGEMFIALIGLGALIKTYGGQFNAAKVFGILLVIIGVAVVSTALVQIVDRRLTRWAD